MDIHQVPYSLLGSEKFTWTATSESGEVVICTWTSSCGNFLAELGAFKARLLDPEDHVARVVCCRYAGAPRFTWTLTVEQGAIRVS